MQVSRVEIDWLHIPSFELDTNSKILICLNPLLFGITLTRALPHLLELVLFFNEYFRILKLQAFLYILIIFLLVIFEIVLVQCEKSLVKCFPTNTCEFMNCISFWWEIWDLWIYRFEANLSLWSLVENSPWNDTTLTFLPLDILISCHLKCTEKITSVSLNWHGFSLLGLEPSFTNFQTVYSIVNLVLLIAMWCKSFVVLILTILYVVTKFPCFNICAFSNLWIHFKIQNIYFNSNFFTWYLSTPNRYRYF